jgi:O-antigen/teichoic acid export membrane protein
MIAGVRRFAAGDFARHGALVFVATMFVNVLGYAFHFAISRKVGVVQYGVLAALNALYMVSMVVTQIASTVVIKYAAEFRVTNDEAHLAALARRLSLYGSAAGIVAIGIGAVCAPAIAAYLNIQSVPAVTLSIVVMGITMVTPTLRAVFAGIEDFRMFSISAVMESTLKAVLGIGAVYAGYGVVGAFAGWAAGCVVTLAYTMTALLARFRHAPRAVLFIDFRRLVGTMTGVTASTVLLTAITYADVIIVKHYADPTTAGLYGALSLSGKILLFLVAFVPLVLLPKTSRRAVGGTSAVGPLIGAVGVVLALSGAGLVAYYAFPAFIITTLAGPSFAPAAPFVFTYGIAMVLLGALNTVIAYKIGIHRFDFVWPLALCAAAELGGIAFYHTSLAQIIEILVAGNAVALAASLYRINAPLRSVAPAQRSDAAA